MLYNGRNWYYLEEETGKKITNKLVWDHLNEKIILGQRLRKKVTNSVTLDFDFDMTCTRAEYQEFVKKVIGLINAPKLIYTSSASHNFHCIFYIRPESAEFVKNHLTQFLRNHGITVQAGKLEIFCTSGKTIRLPFGKGSIEVDNNLMPTGRDRFEVLRSLPNKINLKQLPFIYNALPSVTYSTDKRTRVIVEKAESQTLESLLEEGLQSPGTMNESLLKVVRHFFEDTGGHIEMTQQLTKQWAELSHNGYSKDYLRNKEELFQKIDEMVLSWATKVSEGCTVAEMQNPAVPLSHCQMLIEIFKDVLKYPKQVAVFRLLQKIRPHVLRDKEFILSRSFMCHEYLGFHPSNYKIVIDKLHEHELIIQTRSGNNLKGHSTFYKWIGPKCENEMSFQTFQEYLEYDRMILNYPKRYIQRIYSELKTIKEVKN